jgi:Spy/CpxP family protein refolding chaperone
MKFLGLRIRSLVLLALVLAGVAAGASATSSSSATDDLADGGQWGNKGGKSLC